ncbi:MAG: hypothetical protein IJV41_02245 [Oscillospiraceae bacterium]|nr:hypothetical protein [Oscillospiraceae bacterium]
MTKVIVLGHGGYASGMQRNLAMLVGELEDFLYVDFNEQDDLEILRRKLAEAMAAVGDAQVLFSCDVAGGSPFREAAAICLEHPDWCCVAGINTSAYSEISFNTELSAAELADMAIETTQGTLLRFPPLAE